MVPYDLYETQNLISKDFSIPRVVTCLLQFSDNLSTSMLQLQDLRMGQAKEPCIGFTQENSIESSLQSHLPYIPILMVCAHYCAAYSK